MLAALTGRQVALLLEPYARYRNGLSVRFTTGLYPGGLTLRPTPGGSEVTALADVKARLEAWAA